MLGKRVAQLREARGWTQAQLAEKLHTSEAYIGHIECGRRFPKLDKVLLLANAFGISITDLIETTQPQEAEAVA